MSVILFTGEGLASQHISQVTWPVGLPTEGVGQTPPPRTRNAGGTHPTGMLSCYTKDFSHTKNRKCETGSKSPLVSFMLPFILISTWNYVVLSDSAQGTSYSSSRLWCRIQHDGWCQGESLFIWKSRIWTAWYVIWILVRATFWWVCLFSRQKIEVYHHKDRVYQWQPFGNGSDSLRKIEDISDMVLDTTTKRLTWICHQFLKLVLMVIKTTRMFQIKIGKWLPTFAE